MGALGLIGFVNSFAAVEQAAWPSFGPLAPTVPLGIVSGTLGSDNAGLLPRVGPGLLVTLVRCLTVAKVDSIGLVVRRWAQCSAGLVAERQLFKVIGDLSPAGAGYPAFEPNPAFEELQRSRQHHITGDLAAPVEGDAIGPTVGLS